jgi:N-acetylmuramic acid 6-phosphate etherase
VTRSRRAAEYGIERFGSGGTEDRNPSSARLAEMTVLEIVDLMNQQEAIVLDALDRASVDLARAASAVATIYQSGGRVFLVGSGTSGRLAVMEAAELPPTFGIPEGRFVPLIASGPTGGAAAITRDEDDTNAGPHAMASAECGPSDGVIGLAASGATPFVIASIRYAAEVGTWTCGIANNPGVPLLDKVDVGVLLDTGPEVLTGSTRLKAGTSQKLALNRITTAALVASGLVISNLMVEVRPTNMKLKARCVRIVAALTGLSEDKGVQLLEEADWSIRDAVKGVTEHTNEKDLATGHLTKQAHNVPDLQ